MAIAEENYVKTVQKQTRWICSCFQPSVANMNSVLVARIRCAVVVNVISRHCVTKRFVLEGISGCFPGNISAKPKDGEFDLNKRTCLRP